MAMMIEMIGMMMMMIVMMIGMMMMMMMMMETASQPVYMIYLLCMISIDAWAAHCGQVLGSSMLLRSMSTSTPALQTKHRKKACFRSGMIAEQRTTMPEEKVMMIGGIERGA